ncbi:MAG: hypothetical protein Q7S96_01695 [bacterium]|nr:hypothetical protein [bacterium]
MLTIGPFTINLMPLLAVADDPLATALFLLTNGGWIVFLVFFLWMAKHLWYEHAQGHFIEHQLRPVLLAIDVPKRSVQTPKGVENIFAHLAGAHGSSNRREQHLQGKIQEWFSLEIVSIDGYIRFLVWSWDKYRDLVETAIYAQYTDAQITEVQDYTRDVPHLYPNSEWDLWGTDFVFTKNQAYPLRTWEEFEHKGQKDEPFKDPLAATLESMARLLPGEQIWMQILLIPIDQKWQGKAMEVVKKLIGAKIPVKKNMMDKALEITGSIVTPILEQTIGFGPTEAEKKNDGPESKILFLSPGERMAVEAIEKKAGKIGFRVKLRTIYVGRKDVFKKQHGAHAIIGAIKQYNTNDLNALKPDFKNVGPSSLWLFKDYRNNRRKTKVVKAYSARSAAVGMPTYVMNIEELASIWHFPTEAVHAPLIMKTEAKRAVPPTGLPVERTFAAPARPPSDAKEPPKVTAPEGLPIVP